MEKNNTGAIVGISILSILLLGTATYFIIKGSKLKPLSKNDTKNDTKKDQNQQTNTQTQDSTATSSTPFDLNFFKKLFQGAIKTKDETTITGFSFPIKKGQKGANIKKLQQLLLTFDKSILPKFKDDGDFGTETENALIKLINKNSVNNQADIDAIVFKIKEKASSIFAGTFLRNF